MAWQVAPIEEMRYAMEMLVKTREYLGDITVNGRILLKWILKKQGETMWCGFILLMIGTNVEDLCT
jgi:hypothetical protein